MQDPAHHERPARVVLPPKNGALRTVTDPYCASLHARLDQAHVLVELVMVNNSYGLPVCVAYVWSEDYPVWFAGGGCHVDAPIALSRAVTESVQSRLTCIAGTREDLLDDAQRLEQRLAELVPELTVLDRAVVLRFV
ncbi:YcaO-like family protein [Streptomyces sp. NPDC056527]|uniref:YcaO-like family protein n=1 Tax=Streptomyces sp. NPDC056527 TaxID=3345853 RepID=UPI0036AABE70